MQPARILQGNQRLDPAGPGVEEQRLRQILRPDPEDIADGFGVRFSQGLNHAHGLRD